MDKRDIPIFYNPPAHLGHCQPNGELPRVQQAPALWQFLVMAHEALEKVPSQATLEGNKDIDVNLRELADSTAMMYGVTLEDMFNAGLVGMARLEAMRVRFPWDDRITAWLGSGGKSYNFLTRDPDKLNRS